MPWINHLPPVCWSTFGILVWNDSGYVNLTQWWYFFIIFEYILHISTPHIMIFCFPLPYFPLSQQVLYFLLSTLVLTLYIDVVLSLSILCGPCAKRNIWRQIPSSACIKQLFDWSILAVAFFNYILVCCVHYIIYIYIIQRLTRLYFMFVVSFQYRMNRSRRE